MSIRAGFPRTTWDYRSPGRATSHNSGDDKSIASISSALAMDAGVAFTHGEFHVTVVSDGADIEKDYRFIPA